jgi:hypothetical protein
MHAGTLASNTRIRSTENNAGASIPYRKLTAELVMSACASALPAVVCGVISVVAESMVRTQHIAFSV